MHNIIRLNYSIKESKEKILKECQERASNDGDGLWGNIQWHENKVFDTIEEANDYINKIDQDYLQIAVKYNKVPTEFMASAKLDEFRKKLDETQKEKDAFARASMPRNAKTAYVLCPKCASKLNKNFVQGRYCPLCHTDLMSSKSLEKLNKYQEKIDGLKTKIKDEEKRLSVKHAKKAEVRWLVKIEYHS